uniref:DNA topoisomerase 2 n=1 Tax=Aegilops tauschii TaxID=37682 RepID=N1QSP3_AEGTA
MGARTPSALVRLRLLGGAGQQDPPQVVFNRLEARGSRKRCTPRGPKSSSSGSRSRSSTTSAHDPTQAGGEHLREPGLAVSREIRKVLTERAKNFNIALDDVSITSLSFCKEFTHAIEAKQVAAQKAERAKFIVEKAEQDKKSAIIRAQTFSGMFVRLNIVSDFQWYVGCEQGDQEDFDSEAKNFNIALDGVSVTSLSFGKEFTHAIEAEQVAAHQAEHAKFIVEKAEQDKKSAIVLYALLTVSVIVTTTDFLGFVHTTEHKFRLSMMAAEFNPVLLVEFCQPDETMPFGKQLRVEGVEFILEKAEQDKKKSIIRALLARKAQGASLTEKVDKVYPEGTHIVIPWLERPIIYDIHARTQPGREHLREPESPDGNILPFRSLCVIYWWELVFVLHDLCQRLPTMYRTLGENYNGRVLPSIIHETLKAVVAQYNASQLITQRVQEMHELSIRKNLNSSSKNSRLGFQFALSLLQDHLPVYTIDHNASHIKGLLINFIHSEWPFLFKVPSFLVDFITPIIKATNNQSIAVKSFYLLPDYEAWKEQLGGNGEAKSAQSSLVRPSPAFVAPDRLKPPGDRPHHLSLQLQGVPRLGRPACLGSSRSRSAITRNETVSCHTCYGYRRLSPWKKSTFERNRHLVSSIPDPKTTKTHVWAVMW